MLPALAALLLPLLLTAGGAAAAAPEAAALLREGDAAFSRGEYSGAIRHYTDAIDADPSQVRPRPLLRYWGRGGRAGRAAGRRSRATLQRPAARSARTRAERGGPPRHRAAPTKAHGASAWQPNQPAAPAGCRARRPQALFFTKRAAAYMSLRQHSAALRDLNQAIAADDTFTQGYLHRGKLHRWGGVGRAAVCAGVASGCGGQQAGSRRGPAPLDDPALCLGACPAGESGALRGRAGAGGAEDGTGIPACFRGRPPTPRAPPSQAAVQRGDVAR
jgi:tetratricopeptide (TPR) repeat protein